MLETSGPTRSAVSTASVSPDPVTPERFFEMALDASHRAEAAAGGVCQEDYLIARSRIRLRFAGEALRPALSSAFKHLLVESAEGPDLTVHIWDSATTGVSMPPPPWPKEAQTAGGEITPYITEDIYTHFDGGVRQLSLINYRKRLAILWVQSASYVPYWEQSAPLKSIMHIWMSRKGLRWIHGGAVGMPDGGALLVGLSGAGKSSTALACLDSQLSYVGDDHCLVGFDPQPFVHSLYNSAKTHRYDLDLFPFMKPMVSNPDDGGDGRMRSKALCFLHERFSDKIIPGFPLKVMLLSRVSGRRHTEVRPASSIEGLRIIAPEVMMKWPSYARESFETLSRLFKDVPCLHLDVGTDRSQIPEVIHRVLSEL